MPQAKVERTRATLLWACLVQLVVGPPYAVWVLYVDGPDQQSQLAACVAAAAVIWTLAGVLGLYAVSLRRVQALVVFTSLEVFSAMLLSGAMAALLLLNHLQCWEQRGAINSLYRARAPWLRCSNLTGILGATIFMVMYLGGTAAVALSLRLRIQKTGKRNLNWNQTSATGWKDRNVRRGGSHALRAITNGKDNPGDEDGRLKYLATHDGRYIQRSLLLRFATVEEGEAVRLLLNLRKGYFKHGSAILGTKIYLSQVSEILLGQLAQHSAIPSSSSSAAAAAELDASPACAPDLAPADVNGKRRRRAEHLSRGAAPCYDGALGCVEGCLRFMRRGMRQLRLLGCRSPAADEIDATTIYTLEVHARIVSGCRLLFGLTSRSRTLVLQFRQAEERSRFLSLVQALLPPSIPILPVSGDLAAEVSIGLAGYSGSGALTCLSEKAGAPQGAADAMCSDSGGGGAAVLRSEPGLFHHLDVPPIHTEGVPPIHTEGAAAAAGGRRSAVSSTHLGQVRTERLSLWVGSWNMGDALPPASLDGWMPREAYDLYAVGVQELSDDGWLAALDAHLGSSYVRVTDRRMGGVSLALFSHRRHASKLWAVETSFTPTGVLGVGTNKGAVGVAFSVRGVRVCVVNAHLAAHQDALLQRNRSIQDIANHLRLGATALELGVQFHTIWCGDLNYRVDRDRAEVMRLIQKDQWHLLHEHDQLKQEMGAHRVLFGFSEAPLLFPPTYKYVRHTAAPMLRRTLQQQRAFVTFVSKRVSAVVGGASPPAPSRSTPEKPERRDECQPATPSANGKERTGGAQHGAAEIPQLKRQQSNQLLRCLDLSSSDWIGADGGSGLEKPRAHLEEPDTAPRSAAAGGERRPYDEEKQRVPSWCDRVLSRSLPGPYPLEITAAAECDDAFFYGSDHAPVHTSFEIEVPVLPTALLLHHCTIYLTNLELYRYRPIAQSDAAYVQQNLTARSAQGKGVPLPVTSNKLQNLPPQLSVQAHLLVLHRLMTEPPQHLAGLNSDGKGATNIVIGPMLVQREYLALQPLQLRITSLTGGRSLEIGQAALSLAAAAQGRPMDFDAIVEHLTVPAGYNLRGTVTVVYTKTLGVDSLVEKSGRMDMSARLFGGPSPAVKVTLPSQRGGAIVERRRRPSRILADFNTKLESTCELEA